MLVKNPFYHSITRKAIIAMGGLFSNIFTRTVDSAGVTKKIVNVPLAYAPKEKFLVRLQQDPGLEEDVQIVLPRLSFELVGFDYDSSRQLNKVNSTRLHKDGKTVLQYSPVPYNLSFNLYSFTRTQEDNLQILEQIVPYFTPDMNLSIKVMQNPDVIQDCALILNSLNTDDQYDGGFEDRRYIITTYSFTMKVNYFGPLLGSFDPEGHFENGISPSVIKKVSVNINSTRYTAVVDPFEAGEGDIHQIIESFQDRNDIINDFGTGNTL